MKIKCLKWRYSSVWYSIPEEKNGVLHTTVIKSNISTLGVPKIVGTRIYLQNIEYRSYFLTGCDDAELDWFELLE